MWENPLNRSFSSIQLIIKSFNKTRTMVFNKHDKHDKHVDTREFQSVRFNGLSPLNSDKFRILVAIKLDFIMCSFISHFL